MVFQSYALYPHLTVAENIAVPLRMRRLNAPAAPAGRARPAAVRAASAARSATPCRPVAAHAAPREPARPQARRSSPAARSSAWRSAAPWCVSRKAFLMDEPLSNLDAELRVHMRAEIAAAAPPARRHVHLRDARPGRGDDHVGPRRGDARRRSSSRSPRPASSIATPTTCGSPQFVGSAAHQRPARPSQPRATASTCWARRIARRQRTAGRHDAAGRRSGPHRADRHCRKAAPGLPGRWCYRENLGSDLFLHVAVDGVPAPRRSCAANPRRPLDVGRDRHGSACRRSAADGRRAAVRRSTAAAIRRPWLTARPQRRAG